ncbi:MAG TPA: HAMP domain-containing sensor histidine kinase [Gemmatimonadaceae bacterium]|nr:HAMP domain-containing sensor histidine kinase [Gemmatimonadaceae bacterium]
MTRLGFRTRVLLCLVAFAVIPAGALMLGGAVVTTRVLPVISGGEAWDSVAATGARALVAARQAPLTASQRAALRAHEQELAASVTQARRLRYLASRAAASLLLLAAAGLALLALVASRVAGHLSRQLSRPVDELVGWTERIAHGEPLPAGPPRRGAPEFQVLRERMRRMADELAVARSREVRASRLEAFRETARRMAHELKNPLTPIRFAVERLRRDAPPALSDTVEVLDVESERLERMARSFSQFGRLPEGPLADVDVGEMVRYCTRAVVPESLSVEVQIEPGLPMVRGQYDALARALTNVLLNAVDACTESAGAAPRISVIARTARDPWPGGPTRAVELLVRDTGPGIAPDVLDRLWEPYVTTKAGGTGLGLAIVRQTIVAHGGATDARSIPGQGTEIRLLLPVEPIQSATRSRSEESHGRPGDDESRAGRIGDPRVRESAGARVPSASVYRAHAAHDQEDEEAWRYREN